MNKICESVIFRSWWVFLLVGVCFAVYSHAMQKKKHVFLELEHRFQDLEIDRELALKEREDLLLQIRSQQDPAWVQMTLMKGLGVVPEGQTKVYFNKEDGL